MLSTGFSPAMRHDFHSTQPMMTASTATPISIYTTADIEAWAVNMSIHRVLTYHDATTPIATAGPAT